MKNLKDKTALVTGASRGIGRETALHLAKLGASVIVHYGKNDNKANDLIDQIQELDVNAYKVRADLSNSDNIVSLFDEIDSILNDKKIDILVNNAGVLHRLNIEEISEDQYDELFNVNVKAAFFITKEVIKRMNNGGRIINITSYLSKRPKYDYGAYSMTKAALDNFTKSIAFKLGSRQITVNSVAPGSTDTDMNTFRFHDPELKKKAGKLAALGRVGEVSDIARVVGFLASPDSSWITGQHIEVSGGLGLE